MQSVLCRSEYMHSRCYVVSILQETPHERCIDKGTPYEPPAGAAAAVASSCLQPLQVTADSSNWLRHFFSPPFFYLHQAVAPPTPSSSGCGSSFQLALMSHPSRAWVPIMTTPATNYISSGDTRLPVLPLSFSFPCIGFMAGYLASAVYLSSLPLAVSWCTTAKMQKYVPFIIILFTFYVSVSLDTWI